MKKTTYTFFPFFSKMVGVFCFSVMLAFNLNAQCTKSGTTTYNGVATPVNISNTTFNGDVVIVGGNVTFTGTIRMKKDAFIRVMPGATLNINNATITTATGCGTNTWQGIEVATSSANRFTAFGYVNVQNSTIEKAQVAILNSSITLPYASFKSGMVNCNNSTFKNNWADIILRDEYIARPMFGYTQEITNCTFINDDLSLIPTTFPPYFTANKLYLTSITCAIGMNNTSKSIRGCNFSSSIYFKKTCIVLNDASGNITGNNFSNNYTGIETYRIETNKSSWIEKNSFFNNGFDDILIAGVNTNTMINNKFTQTFLYRGIPGLPNYNDKVFLRVQGASMNNGIERSVTNGYLGQPHFQYTNAGTANQIVNNNSFTSSSNPKLNTQFIRSNGIHYSTNGKIEQGLAINCNQYYGTNQTGNYQLNGGIRKIQADYNAGTILAAAGNRFSASNTSRLHIDNDVANKAVAHTYYYDGLATTSNLKYPAKVSPLVKLVQFNKANQCATIVPRSSDGMVAWNPSTRALVEAARTEASTLLESKKQEFTNNPATTEEGLLEQRAQLTVLKAQKDYMTHYLIAGMYRLAVEGEDLDRTLLHQLYRSYDHPAGIYAIVQDQFDYREYEAAFATLASIPATYPLSIEELAQHTDLVAFYTLLRTLYTQDKTIMDVDASQKAQLQQWAAREAGEAKYRACNWLNMLEKGSCIAYTPAATTEEPIPTTAERTDIAISLYPNPATTTMQVDVTLPADIATAQWVSYSMEGNTMASYPVGAGTQVLTIATATYPQGLYYYQLKLADNTVLKSGAFIVNKE